MIHQRAVRLTIAGALPEERALAYAQFLVTCAGCHRTLRADATAR